MKSKFISLLGLAALMAFAIGCKKPVETPIRKFSDVKLKVSFTPAKSVPALKSSGMALTKETPTNYFVALKSVKLLGKNGTDDLVLFNHSDLKSSFVFDFTDSKTVHSLLKGTTIPPGDFGSIKIELYFLQMNLKIATQNRGVEHRDIRVYLSDDAETENGLHQPGDMTQINNGTEIGWLLGEGQKPDMDPVAPRTAAYTYNGDGTSWYDFAGKSGKDFGPFGDSLFALNAPHPIYSTKVDFNFVDKGGTNLILDFNVNNCWQFEDKSGDGVFGYADLDPVHPTRWHMALPVMTVSLD